MIKSYGPKTMVYMMIVLGPLSISISMKISYPLLLAFSIYREFQKQTYV